MMNVLKIFFVLLMLNLSGIKICCSQLAPGDHWKGYVITKTNDTLYGIIIKKFDESSYKFYDRVFFMQNNHNEIIKYDPDQVKAFKADSNLYFSKTISSGSHEEKVFMRQLIKGRVNLYYLVFYQRGGGYIMSNEGTGMPTGGGRWIGDVYYVEKWNSLYMVSKKKRFREKAIEMFKDCHSIIISEKEKFDDDEIKTLVTNYNNCFKM